MIKRSTSKLLITINAQFYPINCDNNFYSNYN